MIAMDETWEERCRRVAAKRPPPPEPEFVPIAAEDLVVGDRFVWGDNHTMRITALAAIDDRFLRAECAHESHTTTIDLHRREEVLVLDPRPLTTRETTR